MLTAVAAALSGGQQPVLPGFLNSLSSPLEHYGLWAVLFFVLVEDFGIPVPGETILIAAAVFAGSGRLNVVAVGLVGFCAAVVGDNIGYAIGRFGGRALVERWGKYVFITPERLDKAEDFFNRHGGKIIVVARFIEGLRQANGLIAGITEMRWLKFLPFNALGAALWVGTWVSAGYFAGQHIAAIYTDITRYSLYAAIAAVVLIAAWIILRVRRHRRSRGAASDGAGSSPAPQTGQAPAASAGRAPADGAAQAPAAPARSAPANEARRAPADEAAPESAGTSPESAGGRPESAGTGPESAGGCPAGAGRGPGAAPEDGAPAGTPGTGNGWQGVAVTAEPRGAGPAAAGQDHDDSDKS